MIQNGADMVKCNKNITKYAASGIIILTVSVILFLAQADMKKKNEYQGEPDVVSSMTKNDDCYLNIVANVTRVENRKKFAEKVIYMYRENTFHTVKFSTDCGEPPENLYITVYLRKSDIKNGRKLFCFYYNTVSRQIDLCPKCD